MVSLDGEVSSLVRSVTLLDFMPDDDATTLDYLNCRYVLESYVPAFETVTITAPAWQIGPMRVVYCGLEKAGNDYDEYAIFRIECVAPKLVRTGRAS